MFTTAKPIVRNYVNLNSLTKRIAEIDSQKSTILWLGVGIFLVGCGVATVGSGGLALAGCALFGSAPAMYDVFGGDPSQGAADAWRKMAELSPQDITKMECNAIRTITEQARLIDLEALPNKEGASKTKCPSIQSLLAKNKSIRGIQAGADEVKNKSSAPSLRK